MTTKPNSGVFIVSTALDLETDAVVRLLSTRGFPCVRLNSESLPFERELTWMCFDDIMALSLDGQVLAPSAVWLRKLRGPAQPPPMDKGIYEFCRSESYRALTGALMTIKCNRYMSPFEHILCAENKLHQLSVAKQAGLHIPQTVVSNQPQAVLDAYRRFHGQMICKPVHSGFVEDGATGKAIYTSRVLEEHLTSVESAGACPSIYQELLEKQCDVRVVYIGGRVLAASIDSQSDPAATIDWRATKNPYLPHNKIEIPPSLHQLVVKLMAVLGLSYGALDFVRTKAGEWVFLEVNPNGQWLWLDDFLSLGVTEAVADWLAGNVEAY